MKLTGAQILWESLVREGVTDVFGYPGGAILPAYDAMLGYPIRHILVRHEQGATHMADGYARASGRVGVAIATSAFVGLLAGTLPLPSAAMPRNSQAIAMVFAVNWPPQAPTPGQATDSSAQRSPSLIRPAACAPTASKTSWMVTSRPFQWPGAIDPP